MAAKWTIDNLNRLLILKAGVTDIDVEVDLYSDWKEEYKLAANAAFPPAMRSIGGDPVTAIKNAGATFFMINGWRIRPQEANHTLNITGNLFTDPAGDSVVVNTLGAFNVRVEMFVSNLVDSSVARLDLVQLLNSVYIDTINGTSGTAEGVGTPTNPVDNLTDARTIADRDNLRSYTFRGPVTINADHDDWTFQGQGSTFSDIINLGGFSFNNTKFNQVTGRGTLTGLNQDWTDSVIDGVSGLRGVARNCGLTGSISCQGSGAGFLDSCYSLVPGTSAPIYTVAGSSSVAFRNYSGGVDFRGSTALNTATIEADPGSVTLHASNTGGTIVVRGVGTLTDNSAGATVISTGFVDSEGLSDIIVNGVNLKSINGSVLAAVLMAIAAETMARGTISVVNSPTSIEVQWQDGFDPEAGDGIAGRAILFTSGPNVKGGARISALDGQGAGDPLLTLTYAGTNQPTPSVSDTVLLV